MEKTRMIDQEEMEGVICLSWDAKEKGALGVVKSALDNSHNPFVAFSGGKRSLVLLDMARRSGSGKLNVLHVETGAEFERALSYTDKIRRLWGLNLQRLPSKGILPFPGNRLECCRKLILEPLEDATARYEIDCLLIGSAGGDKCWQELLGSSENNKCDRVYPLLHFTDEDIWAYIEGHNLPFCSLYNQGFQSVDCKPCSESVAAERTGAEEEALIKERLKKLGYI